MRIWNRPALVMYLTPLNGLYFSPYISNLFTFNPLTASWLMVKNTFIDGFISAVFAPVAIDIWNATWLGNITKNFTLNLRILEYSATSWRLFDPRPSEEPSQPDRNYISPGWPLTRSSWSTWAWWFRASHLRQQSCNYCKLITCTETFFQLTFDGTT